jgi:hypothetical protein
VHYVGHFTISFQNARSLQHKKQDANLLRTWTRQYTSRLPLPVDGHDWYPYTVMPCPAFPAPLTCIYKASESLQFNSQREMRSRCMSATLCHQFIVTQAVTRFSARHSPPVRQVPSSKLGTRDRLFYGRMFLWFPVQSVDNIHLASFHIPILSLDAILSQLLTSS